MRLFGTPATFCHSRSASSSSRKTVTYSLSLGEAELLRQQLPGESDGVLLEIVAEGKIAQHLEEGVVAARVADVVEIVVLAARADALSATMVARL